MWCGACTLVVTCTSHCHPLFSGNKLAVAYSYLVEYITKHACRDAAGNAQAVRETGLFSLGLALPCVN